MAREPTSTGNHKLLPEELRQVEHFWIKHVQYVAFTDEIRVLEDGKPLPSRSSLHSLTPFKDEEGLLRVGGRLKHVILSFNERYLIILPPPFHFTKLVIEAFHRRSFHGGVQLTVGLIRRRIPRGRQLVRQFIHRCPTFL